MDRENNDTINVTTTAQTTDHAIEEQDCAARQADREQETTADIAADTAEAAPAPTETSTVRIMDGAESPTNNGVTAGIDVGADEERHDVANAVVPDTKQTNSALDKKIDEMSFDERRSEAIEIAAYFEGIQQTNRDFVQELKALKSQFPVLADCTAGYFGEMIASVKNCTAGQRNNIFAAYVLFYVLTAGKYPHECWKNAIKKPEDTPLGEIRSRGKELAVKLSAVGHDKTANEILDTTKKFQRQTESDDIAPLLRDNEQVGNARIYELFWEVFIMKYGNYRPSLWKSVLTEFKEKKYAKRDLCEFAEQCGKTEIYAVAYEGKLDKPMHYTCEDCSFVTVFDEHTWLAVAADGVGSCINSHIGSQLATEMLSETIAAYLQSHHLLTTDTKRRLFGTSHGTIDKKEWAALMYFLRFDLASELYTAWNSAVRESQEFKDDPQAEIGQFTSTLQFAFGCEAFTACGKIGDGTFFVKKKETSSAGAYYGGVLLNDCISGVTQTAVLTIAHLKANPTALQVDFFAAGEITDIIISSDGASDALGYTVEDVDKLAQKMHALPFEKRCDELSRIARIGSDYNETQHGSGDDSTVVYIRFEEQK